MTKREKELAELCKENCCVTDEMITAYECLLKGEDRAIKALDMLDCVMSRDQATMKDLGASNKASSDYVDLLKQMIDVQTQDVEILHKELSLAKEGKFL